MARDIRAMLAEFRQMYAVEEKKPSPDKKQLVRLREKMNRAKARGTAQPVSRNTP